MKIKKFEGIITATTSISQSGDGKTGASVCLPRQMQYIEQKDNFIELPFIAGNSIRGYLRRLIMRDFCDQLDWKFTQLDTFHAFFDGGALQSMEGENGILNLDLRKKILELIPPIRLFGFSLGNQQVGSIMQVNPGIICCSENRFRIPEKYHEKCKYEHFLFIDNQFFTRKDESGNAGLQKNDDDPTIQMKVDLEVYIPGTMFYHKFTLIDPSEIEESCFGRMINLWKEKSSIGGKASVGFGSIKLDYVDIPESKRYLEFLASKKEDIKKLLDEMQNLFIKKKKVKGENKQVES